MTEVYRSAATMVLTIVLGVLGISDVFAGSGTSEKIIIGCGGTGSAYYQQICPQIKQRLEALGYTNVQTVESKGSGDNLAKVVSGDATAGLVQMDVLAQAVQTNSELAFLLALGQITPEGLWMVRRKVSTWEMIAKGDRDGMPVPAKKYVVGIAGGETSGSYLTMKFLMDSIQPLQENVQLKAMTSSPEVMLNYLNTNALTYVSFVQMPDITNERIATVLNSKLWEFVPINDERIAALSVEGSPVYTLMDIPLEGTMSSALGRLFGSTPASGKTIRIPVTYATLVVDPQKTSDALVKALSAIANDPNLLPDTSPTGMAARLYRAARGK